MRHAGSLLLSLFAAPLIWVATGYGLNEIGRTRQQFTEGFKIEIVLGLAALVAGGALYALLVMARLSPVGPALIGVVFLGLSGWAAFDSSSYFDTMPTSLRDNDFALIHPALGYSALLAVPLLATLLSPRRWRRYAHPSAASPAGAPPYPVPPPGFPPGAVPPGAYPPPYAGAPAFTPAPGHLAPPPPPQPGRLTDPAPTAPFPAPPSSVPPAPPPVSPAPAEATTKIPAQPSPPSAEQDATTRLSQPSPSVDAPTTRIPAPPAPAAPPPTTPPPPTAPPADEATTRIGGQDTEATQMLKGPPPKDAYPRPAWSAPTPPPITPGARDVNEEPDDPEATQPSR